VVEPLRAIVDSLSHLGMLTYYRDNPDVIVVIRRDDEDDNYSYAKK